MVNEGIIDKAHADATHYLPANRRYYKVDHNATYFFSRVNHCWCISGGAPKTELVPLKPNGWVSRPSFITALPEHVRAHVTEDPKTKKLILWDETGAYEVCKSHYPLVLVAAMEVYDKEYLNKH